MAASVVISILANVRDAVRGLRDTGDAADSMGTRVANASRSMTAPALGALGAIGAGAFAAGQAASEMSDSISASQVVFGSAAKAVEDFASSAAKSFGLSKQAALDASGTFGTIGKAAGLSGTDLSNFSNQFVGLAGDLASFKGGSPEEAVEAIGAALRGEAEPIRRYGILLDDATLRNEALKLGLIKTTKEALTPQQKALAASQAILAQSKDAMGDFARTSDSAKNQQVALKAQLANVTAELGAQLLPVMAAVAGKLGAFVGFVKENKGAVTALVAVLASLAAIVLVVNAAIKIYEVTMVIVSAAQRVWTAVTAAFNFVMAANPIVLVVIAIVALIAVIVLAYQHSEAFRNIVNALWSGLKAGAMAVVDFFSGPFASFFVNLWRNYIVKPFEAGVAAVAAAWSAVKSATSAVWSAVQAVIAAAVAFVQGRIQAGIANVTAVWSTIVNLANKAIEFRDRVFAIFANAGSWLVDAGRKIIDGLLNAISDGFNKVKDKLSQLTNLIPDWKGPAQRDRTLLYDSGKLIMRGLVSGIDSQAPALRRTLAGVTNDIAGLSAMPTVDLRTTATGTLGIAGTGTGTASTVNINVSVPPSTDPGEVGRQVVKAIKAYQQQIGRQFLAGTA
ncbi:hypothetical protein ACFO1B_03850 [Dactylosporangium siamense]|uniref:Phage tail tape measure protein n=1 Tax=Dactylosporangium siamense TaxID=685454 RepID=A0A919PIT4_9ACTN|nr:hypothetical protein [Dactylosporangium siamense]GIG42983.1 hypothetical protein Dsi01nite_010240 [Dactylosporangium siamense]